LISLLDSLMGGIGLTDNKARCLDNFRTVSTAVFVGAKSTSIVIQVLFCDTIIGSCPGVITNSPGCVVSTIFRVIANIAQTVLNACDEQDDRVDSAEIEAAYENSLILITGLSCVQVAQMRKFHGCNGGDDNCDGVIDECAEDSFPPDVQIDVAVADKFFKTTAEALAKIAEAVSASDDCGSVSVGAPSVASISCKGPNKNCTASVDVTATDDCSNSATDTITVEIKQHTP
jgi:hypothetical protein